VRQVSEQIVKILSVYLEKLENALGEMDIEKMRHLQKVLNKEEISSF